MTEFLREPFRPSIIFWITIAGIMSGLSGCSSMTIAALNNPSLSGEQKLEATFEPAKFKKEQELIAHKKEQQRQKNEEKIYKARAAEAAKKSSKKEAQEKVWADQAKAKKLKKQRLVREIKRRGYDGYHYAVNLSLLVNGLSAPLRKNYVYGTIHDPENTTSLFQITPHLMLYASQPGGYQRTATVIAVGNYGGQHFEGESVAAGYYAYLGILYYKTRNGFEVSAYHFKYVPLQ